MHTLLVTRGATIKEAHTLGLHTQQVRMWSFKTDEYHCAGSGMKPMTTFDKSKGGNYDRK
jgi:hypothetical protein